MRSVKHSIKKILTSCGPGRSVLRTLAGPFPRIFVYHRFAPPNTIIPHRVSADTFGWQLDRMKDFGRIMTLADCLEHHHIHGVWPRHAVVITVDDGYRDFYLYAFPELKRRSIPATLFPTVNFIEGRVWLWPDRLAAALEGASDGRITVTAHGDALEIGWNDNEQRARAWKSLSDLCISLPDHLRQAVIRQVEDLMRVDLPVAPPEEYAACSWGELQEMAAAGIEIGSHTINHPILSRIPLDNLDHEIADSKRHLERKIGQPIKTFCYPNSAPGDINDAVVAAVQRAGYLGAVFGTDLKAWEPWRMPRMGLGESRTDFLWKLVGGEIL